VRDIGQVPKESMGTVGRGLKLKFGATYCFYMLFVNNIKLFTDEKKFTLTVTASVTLL
jgi:hypothetical protein